VSIGEYASYWSGVVVLLVLVWELRYGRPIRKILIRLLEDDAAQTPTIKERLKQLWARVQRYSGRVHPDDF
jgi:hypothetical protein